MSAWLTAPRMMPVDSKFDADSELGPIEVSQKPTV